MDWVWYAIAVVIIFIAVSAALGIVQLKRSQNEAWLRLSDAFSGKREPRAIQIAPKVAADRLDYDDAQFLGYFKLTNKFLKFYWFKFRDGAVIEIPVNWIHKSRKNEDSNEPAATLEVKAPEGKMFTIVANVPQELCNRLIRLGRNVEIKAP